MARCGFTTGSCAALAARAATRMLFSGQVETASSLITPKGTVLTVPLHAVRITADEAECAVRKDAGDDPDVTDGVLVHALARRMDGTATVAIDGGVGVGRVTRPGLDQPVGAAAINSVPRHMIEREVRAVCADLGYAGGISIVVSIPGGEQIAEKTFNPHLGIRGGLSVIGTSGVVEPMSIQAVVETIAVELGVVRAEGATGVILTPGNYGADFLRTMPAFALRPCVKCSNHIGAALDAAVEKGFQEALVVGHIGKLIKLSGGVMDTHSRVADCRLELLALGAALAGIERDILRPVLEAATVDAGLELLGAARQDVVSLLLERADSYGARRGGGRLDVGVVLFSNRLGLLGVSEQAGKILSRWENAGG